VDLFAMLGGDERRAIAAEVTSRVYGNSEAIVRQGEPGQSMFIVVGGQVAVVLEPDKRHVATIDRGGYFGEMSLLTGEPRSATVVARGDALVIEIDAELFRKLAVTHPHAIEQIGIAAMSRRGELDSVKKAAQGTAVAEAPASFISRMRKFLRL
jgi:CRP-like cAMP-binding protein